MFVFGTYVTRSRYGLESSFAKTVVEIKLELTKAISILSESGNFKHVYSF